MPITARRLGRVEYADGLELQRRFVQARMAGAVDDTLLLLEHPPVLTLGRAAKASNILAAPDVLAAQGVEVHETDRGGDVTYHGPGQVVGYPLFFLPKERQDVRKYVRSVEEVLIRAVAAFGLHAHREPKWPGIWVQQSRLGGLRKIGAIGVHLSRWYTRHGFSLNVDPDLAHFSLIVPCGIREAGVTSMAAELGAAPSRAEVEAALLRAAGEVFETTVAEAPLDGRTVSVVVTRPGAAGTEVLLLRRVAARGGFWQPVTGRVEPGESAAAAAARELREETGLELVPAPLDYVHAFAFGDAAVPPVLEETAFVARAPPGAAVRWDPAEHEAFEWVDAAAAQARVPWRGLARAIALATG